MPGSIQPHSKQEKKLLAVCSVLLFFFLLLDQGTKLLTRGLMELHHSIVNRRALALGAVVAGEYLADKSGVHTMDDLL